MSVTKLKGQDVTVSVDGSRLAASTSCSISYEMSTEDVSTKDDESAYFDQPCGTYLSWSVENEAFMSDTGDLSRLMSAWIERAQVLVEAKDANGRVSLRGNGYITSLKCDAPNGEYATVSLTIEGTGSDLLEE